MSDHKNEIVKALFEAFDHFGKINWCCSPVPGLKRSELFMLISIKRISDEKNRIVKVTDISRMLDVTPPTVTQLLNGLEKSGYIERRHDKEDRRVVLVDLTDKAFEVIEFASKQFMTHFEGLVEHLGEEKSHELAELLSQVFAYFEK